MRLRGHRSRTRGIFGRLFLIFIGLFVGISVSFAISFHIFNKSHHRGFVERNMTSYARLLSKEIGIPPTPEKVDSIAKELGLSIGVFGDGLSIKSSPEVPSLQEFNNLSHHKKRRYLKRHRHVLVENNGYTYLFGVDRSLIERSPWPLIFALGVSLLLVILAFHLVERLFQPLHDIKHAAGEYAQGRFDHELSSKGRGLLAELSVSISDMGKRIQSMLDAKRELLLAIAHELRTPITRAKLHLEFIEESDAKNKLNEELDEMSQQITDILEGERLKDGHQVLDKKNAELGQLVSDVVGRHFAGESRITTQLEKSVYLFVDRVKYSLALKNLIENALRYGDDGQVEICLTETDLSVTNSGAPIPDKEIELITEAFYRLEKGRGRESGGVGLGLYLVQQVVKAHGHLLEISSGDKTTFKISWS